MSETTSAPAVDAAPAPIDVQPPAISQESFADASEAARYLASLRGKKPEAESAEPQEAATAEPELPEQGNADPETDPGEQTEATEQDQNPPIEPPRSWTKEAKDRWATLPRETQEYLAQREQERDRGLRQSQNEIAEARKAAQAEREAVEKARKDYEAKLPALMQALQDANAGQFSDIRTIDDVTKLAQEDPFRYLQWQAHQSKMAAVQSEMDKANKERETETQSKWAKHVQDESARFAESLSEADQKRLEELNRAAPDFLKERGFTPQELTDLANGKDKLSIWDHRVQSLILDGMKYQALQKAPPKAVQKPVPPVQRPGAAQPRGAANVASIQALNQRLSESGSIDDALALMRARRTSKG